jgi:hypothetical protein
MTTPASGPNSPTERVLPQEGILAPDPESPSLWQRWTHFWFMKADPTTLAFIRISTGLLVLYIHLAYSLNLQAFFGKHGWYAASFMDRERHEQPSYLPPFFGGWDDPFAVAQLSEFPHRRQAFMDFLRALPADTAERKMALRYLNRLNEFQNPDEFRAALINFQTIRTKQDFDRCMTLLIDGKLENEALTKSYQDAGYIPHVFMEKTPEERAMIASEMAAFRKVLDDVRWTNQEFGKDYVFNHLVEVSPNIRKAMVEYLNTLPEDPEQRKQLLDYLEYWNSDYRKAHSVGKGIFSVWFHVTDPTQMALVHTGVLVVIVLFTIGLFTRMTSILVWLATVSYIHRTQQVLFGMDTMMNILLFYLMIGNCGAALSIDRLIARYRAARASLRRSGTLDHNTRAFLAYPPPSVTAGFALRLIQVHFCVIYMAAGLSKLKGPAWWDGLALWAVVANPEFTLMQYGWYQDALRAIASNKVFFYFFNILGVWFTLFVEIATPFLIWTRLRWFVILLATAMHAVIGVLMGLNLFELLMIVMLIAFFPNRVIRDRFRGGPDLPRLGLSFNPQTPAHTRAAALAVGADIDNQITLQPDRKAAEVALTGPDGQSSSGQQAVSVLFRNDRLLAILGFFLWVPGVRGLLASRLFPGDDHPKSSTPLKPPATPSAR